MEIIRSPDHRVARLDRHVLRQEIQNLGPRVTGLELLASRPHEPEVGPVRAGLRSGRGITLSFRRCEQAEHLADFAVGLGVDRSLARHVARIGI